jgi:hypothetical protein
VAVRFGSGALAPVIVGIGAALATSPVSRAERMAQQAAQPCATWLSRGMTSGGATGTMHITEPRRACVIRLFQQPEEQRPFTTLVVSEIPRNGSVRIDNPRVSYTARAGFIGTDSFAITSTPDGVLRVSVRVGP